MTRQINIYRTCVLNFGVFFLNGKFMKFASLAFVHRELRFMITTIVLCLFIFTCIDEKKILQSILSSFSTQMSVIASFLFQLHLLLKIKLIMLWLDSFTFNENDNLDQSVIILVSTLISDCLRFLSIFSELL